MSCLTNLRQAVDDEEAAVARELRECAARYEQPSKTYWMKLYSLREKLRVAEIVSPIVYEELGLRHD